MFLDVAQLPAQKQESKNMAHRKISSMPPDNAQMHTPYSMAANSSPRQHHMHPQSLQHQAGRHDQVLVAQSSCLGLKWQSPFPVMPIHAIIWQASQR